MPPKNKGSSGRKPAHQNTFAFRHNPKSKLTEKILASPNVGVCRRCHDKIEWRKQYRKYKPLTQPGKCNLCQQKNVVAAYHTICTNCATSDKAREKMRSLAKESKDKLVESQEVISTDEAFKSQVEKDGVCDEQSQSHDGFIVCAVCCKERALPDDNDNSEISQEIEDQKIKMEQKLGRPLKLREQKAIERRVERTIEREKQRAKEERRRLRDEAAANNIDGQSHVSNSSQDDESQGKNLSDASFEDDMHSEDDEEDPFLKAIGGKEMLLTGEAYQKHLLQKRKELATED
mmetsp:Transcript_4611/g.8868  ORF Transcript_4611/g.8868 Transcript_4611/m.8868 type:complete len:290 (-) Transcript_4611:83-952(-)